MQTVDRIVEVFEEAGIDHIFGIPGGDTGRIYKALYAKQDKIKVVVARDEQTASCMADMYGRLTGKPGVFMAQGCYAASTGLFGVIEAGLGSSPMVVITDITTYGVPPGHGSLQCGGGEYGNFDIAAIFKATCKFTAVAHSPGEGVQAIPAACAGDHVIGETDEIQIAQILRVVRRGPHVLKRDEAASALVANDELTHVGVIRAR